MKIHIISPSSAYPEHQFEESIALLERQGFEIGYRTHLRQKPFAYLNGSDEERLQELMDTFAMPKEDWVWPARGGYGLTRILPMMPKHIKPEPRFIGLSDGTALMGHLWSTWGKSSLHAPGFTILSNQPEDVLNSLWRMLRGETSTSAQLHMLFSLQPKMRIEGTFLVFNLTMLSALIGTPSMPDLHNCVLALEDIGEHPYRIDRMLAHLWASGALTKVKAIILGQFTNCKDNENTSIEAIFFDRCQKLGIPLFSGLQAGHEAPNYPIIFGGSCTLTGDADKSTLTVTGRW